MSTSTRDRILAAAAEARSTSTRSPADRPTQRRNAEESGARPAPVIRAQRISMTTEQRADGTGTGLHFQGFASVYNRGYEMWDFFGPYSEDVGSGAGAESLARADLDVPLVLQHDGLRRIARTTNGTLTVDERTEGDGDASVEGLFVDAPELDPRDADVAYIAPKLQSVGERGPLIDEMSFKFRILTGTWSPDWESYRIDKYDIHRGDVAIVAYGANPHTVGAGLRSTPDLDDMTDAQLRTLENDLHRVRKQRAPVAPTLSALQAHALEIQGRLIG